jgi:small GTP-binding protein
MTDDAPRYKVVFVGDSKVGKTSLIRRYLGQDLNTVATLGATSTRVEALVDGTPIILNVWDTAGQENLRNLVPVYAKGAHAAVIVFDLSEPVSYEHVPGWYDYIHQNVGNIVTCLAANKSDQQAAVDMNEVFQWAADRKIEVTRTSAKEGENVEALFESVARELEKQTKTKQTPVTEVKESVIVAEVCEPVVTQEKATRKGGCC